MATWVFLVSSSKGVHIVRHRDPGRQICPLLLIETRTVLQLACLEKMAMWRSLLAWCGDIIMSFFPNWMGLSLSSMGCVGDTETEGRILVVDRHLTTLRSSGQKNVIQCYILNFEYDFNWSVQSNRPPTAARTSSLCHNHHKSMYHVFLLSFPTPAYGNTILFTSPMCVPFVCQCQQTKEQKKLKERLQLPVIQTHQYCFKSNKIWSSTLPVNPEQWV